jgi:hypothetical protein
VPPGYQSDPGHAVYNRLWLLGDEKAARQSSGICRRSVAIADT